MSLRPIKKIAIIGAGIMGHGFALVFSQKGFPVSLHDVSEEILGKAMKSIDRTIGTFIQYGLIPKKDKERILKRITKTTDLRTAVDGADFVLEAIPEVLEMKQELFRRLEPLAPPHAILASNTSGLGITEIAKGLARPERAIIAHWINPPHIIPIVEIVRGDKTSNETAARVDRLLRKVGKIPIHVLKEVPGFLFNRLQLALYREALYCLETGVATAEDIDLVVKGAYGFRSAHLGPLETSDFGGLDTFLRISQNLYPKLCNSHEAPAILQSLVAQGKLGVKTGAGFYSYPPQVLRKKIQERDRRLIQQLKLFQDRSPVDRSRKR